MCCGACTAGMVLGTIGSFATGEGEANLIFKTEHYAQRLLAEGVDVANAEKAVANEIRAVESTLAGPVSGRITVDGTLIQYNAFPLPGGNINIGTIFPVKW